MEGSVLSLGKARYFLPRSTVKFLSTSCLDYALDFYPAWVGFGNWQLITEIIHNKQISDDEKLIGQQDQGPTGEWLHVRRRQLHGPHLPPIDLEGRQRSRDTVLGKPSQGIYGATQHSQAKILWTWCPQWQWYESRLQSNPCNVLPFPKQPVPRGTNWHPLI